MKKSSRVSKVVENVEAELAPSTPCASAAADKVTALTVRMDALPIPEGSPAEQANALHREFIQSAVSAKIRAVQCGWVLAAQRERIGHGQWDDWVSRLDFSRRTAYNYITAYEGTVGAYRAQQRRPLPLSVEPTMEEIMAATHGAQEKPLAQLYRATGVVENNPNHGGAREGAGRHKKDEDVAAELKAVAENESVIWASAKGSLDNLVQLDAGRDMFHRLSGDHLATVAGLLADLSKKATKALESRIMTEAEL